MRQRSSLCVGLMVRTARSGGTLSSQGTATSENGIQGTMRSNGIEHIIIDRHHGEVVGSSADRTILKQAGITEASTLLVTVNNDLDAIYTPLVARKLNPQIDILCRAVRPQAVEEVVSSGGRLCAVPSPLSLASLAELLTPTACTKLREILLSEDMKVIEYLSGPSLVGKSLEIFRFDHAPGVQSLLSLLVTATYQTPIRIKLSPTTLSHRHRYAENIREFKRVFG